MESYLSQIDLQNIGYAEMPTCLSGGEKLPTGPDICDDQSDVDPLREDKDDDVLCDKNIAKLRISQRHPRRAYGIPEIIEKEIVRTTCSDTMTPDFIRNKIEEFFAANGIEISDNNYSFPIGKRADWDDYRVEKRPHYWYAWNATLKSENPIRGDDVEIRMRLYLSNPKPDEFPQTMVLVCNNTSGRNVLYYSMLDSLGRWIFDETDSTDIEVPHHQWDVFEAEAEMEQSSGRLDGGLFLLIVYCFILYFIIV